MTPSACIDAVAEQVAALTPTTQNTRRDKFRRVSSTALTMLSDRQFQLHQETLPKEPEDILCSTWRWVGLTLRIGYSGTPETDSRIAEDGEQIGELWDVIDQSVAGIVQAESLSAGFVDYDPEVGSGEATYTFQVLYDKAV